MNSSIISLLIRKSVIQAKNNPPLSLFISTLVFYGLLLVINPPNLFVAAAFIGLIGVYQMILRDIRTSAFLAFLASSCIFTGKTYVFPLVPPGIFPIVEYPDGYSITAVITPSHVVAAAIGVLVVKDFLSHRIQSLPIKTLHIFLLLFFLWTTLANLFGSNEPGLSSVYSILQLPLLLVYLFVQSFGSNKKRVMTYALYVAAAMTMFQFSVGLLQFINHAPLGKIIEAQQHITAFGEGADELLFRFRPLGTFGHANSLGAFFAFVLPILLVGSTVYRSKILLLSFLLGTMMLILTLSRSGWLGFLFGIICCVVLIQKHGLKIPMTISTRVTWPVTFVMGFLLLFFIIPRIEQSMNVAADEESGGLSVRILQIKNAIQLIVLHPVFGVGSGLSVPEGLAIEPKGVISTFPSPVHNTFLLMAAENGIPALVFYLLFMILFIRNAFVQKAKSQTATLALGVTIGVISLFIVGNLQPFSLITFMVIFIGLLT